MSKPVPKPPAETGQTAGLSNKLDGHQTIIGLALETLRLVCLDGSAPPAARAQAARTLLEAHGALKAEPNRAVPAHEMTLDDINKALNSLG